jgi:hypothetical protein
MDRTAHNPQGTWKQHKAMTNKQRNSCSTSCRGFWYSMTGDMAKAGPDSGVSASVGKPENRQVRSRPRAPFPWSRAP